MPQNPFYIEPDIPVQTQYNIGLGGGDNQPKSPYYIEQDYEPQGFFPSVYKFGEHLLDTVNTTSKKALQEFGAGEYPAAFHTLAAPILQPFEGITRMGQNKVSGQPAMTEQEVKDEGSNLFLGAFGVEPESFKQAWQHSDYPAVAGQLTGGALTALLARGAGKVLSGGREPVLPREATPNLPPEASIPGPFKTGPETPPPAGPATSPLGEATVAPPAPSQNMPLVVTVKKPTAIVLQELRQQGYVPWVGHRSADGFGQMIRADHLAKLTAAEKLAAAQEGMGTEAPVTEAPTTNPADVLRARGMGDDVINMMTEQQKTEAAQQVQPSTPEGWADVPVREAPVSKSNVPGVLNPEGEIMIPAAKLAQPGAMARLRAGGWELIGKTITEDGIFKKLLTDEKGEFDWEALKEEVRRRLGRDPFVRGEEPPSEVLPFQPRTEEPVRPPVEDLGDQIPMEHPAGGQGHLQQQNLAEIRTATEPSQVQGILDYWTRQARMAIDDADLKHANDMAGLARYKLNELSRQAIGRGEEIAPTSLEITRLKEQIADIKTQKQEFYDQGDWQGSRTLNPQLEALELQLSRAEGRDGYGQLPGRPPFEMVELMQRATDILDRPGSKMKGPNGELVKFTDGGYGVFDGNEFIYHGDLAGGLEAAGIGRPRNVRPTDMPIERPMGQQNLPLVGEARPPETVDFAEEKLPPFSEFGPVQGKLGKWADRNLPMDQEAAKIARAAVDNKRYTGDVFSPEYAKGVLEGAERGEPGLSVTDETNTSEGRYSDGFYKVIFRNSKGEPTVVAEVRDEGNQRVVRNFAANKAAGLSYGRGVQEVLGKLYEMKAFRGDPGDTLSADSAGLIRKITDFIQKNGGDDSGYINMQHIGDAFEKVKGVASRLLSDEEGAMYLGDLLKNTRKRIAEPTREWLDKNYWWGKGDERTNYVREALKVPSSATTTGDMSGSGRQGLPMISTKEFWKAQWPSIRAGLSKEYNDQMMMQLKAKDIFKERYDADGEKLGSFAKEIGLQEPTIRKNITLNQREEATASKWLETGGSIPYISAMWKFGPGRGVAAYNRTYDMVLTHMRVNRVERLLNYMKTMSESAEKTGSARPGLLKQSFTPEQARELNPFTNIPLAREIVDMVNTLTARSPYKLQVLPTSKGEINFERLSPYLSNTLFSGRLAMRSVRMLNPNTYIMAHPTVRRGYARGAISHAIAWMTLAQTAQLLSDNVSVSDDPDSADYGKIRIGNIRIDPGAGFQQLLVAGHRLWGGSYTSSSRNRSNEYGAGFQAPTSFDAVTNFGINKLNPVWKFAVDLSRASDNNPFYPMDRTAQLFVPLFYQDLLSIYQENPDLLPGLFTAGGAYVGLGTQIYDKGDTTTKLIPEEIDWKVTRGGLRNLFPEKAVNALPQIYRMPQNWWSNTPVGGR